MRITDMFGEYLKAEDLSGKQVKVTITSIGVEDLGGRERIVLGFEGKSKKLAVNKTNATAMAEAWGDETDGWRGQTMALSTAPVMFQGKRVMGIQCTPDPLKEGVAAADDDLPF